MLGAPVAAPAPVAPTPAAEPDPADAEPGDGPPIFESVRSGYLHAFGRDLPQSGEQQAGQPPAEEPATPPAEEPARPPAGEPATPPAAWGGDNGHAGAGSQTADAPASSGLPQRAPQPGQVRSAAADQETLTTDSAETTRSKLASFQNGSRRARAVAQANRSATQPEQDG